MKKSIFLALLAIMWAAFPVRAVEPGTVAGREQGGGNRQVLSEVRTQLKAAKCQLNETKINARIIKVEQSRNKHYTAFQNIRKHIDVFITKATAKNCDVTILKQQLVTLNGLVETFSAAFRDWKTSMQAANELRCDPSETKVTGAINTTQGKFTAVRTASEAVRAYVKTTLKPTLAAAVQACKPSPKPASPTGRPSASPELKGNK